MYIRVQQDTIENYSIEKLRIDNPQVSFPYEISDDILKEYNVYTVTPTEKPSCEWSQRVEEGTPKLVNKKWEQVWNIIDLSPEEQAAKRKSEVPDFVSMRQARLALLEAGLLQQVNTIISNLPSPQKEKATIEWEYTSQVRRNSELIAVLGPLLNLSESQIDTLFIDASKM